ncbi:glycosyltransferase [Bacillus cereus]|uniref:glycosyltransferase n=1 Tax=Bacillus cereus TaxID=1396 RepID=UPI00124D0403|nr:glycosyltransferase [Bacillus cereus]KAB2477479.1 glycosyltransferase family 4 protein [Bacillus cereus]
MKHIVFILGVFYPDPAANGYCTKKIIDELKKGNKVTVICYGSDNTKSQLNVENIDIYMLSNWRNKIRNLATKKIAKTQYKMRKVFWKSIITFTRVTRAIVSAFSWPTSEKWFIKKALKELNEINKISPINAIVTVSRPYEAHIVGLEYVKKHKNTKWLTYTLDQFSDHKAIHKYVLNKKKRDRINIQSECEINNKADINFITESRQNWCENLPGIEMKKVRALSFPLMAPLEPSNEKPFVKEDDKVHLLYAGTFYKDIRNPEYLLELFTNINDEKLILHLFSKGDCESIINKYVKKSNGKIINHGAVPVNVVHSALQQADILVNIGNSVKEQLPSKIYEYISAGKPIVNLYQNNLSYENIFKDYPSVLQINQDIPFTDATKEKFLLFCTENKGQDFEYNELERIYTKSTPKYIASVFESYVK